MEIRGLNSTRGILDYGSEQIHFVRNGQRYTVWACGVTETGTPGYEEIEAVEQGVEAVPYKQFLREARRGDFGTSNLVRVREQGVSIGAGEPAALGAALGHTATTG